MNIGAVTTYRIDEDILVHDLLVGAQPVLGLIDIPANEAALRQTGLDEKIDGATATATQSAHDESSGLATKNLLTSRDILGDLLDELILVQVVSAALSELLNTGQLLAGVLELPGPHLNGESSTGETGVVSKGADSATLLVNQKLEVVQHAAAAREARQDLLPATLALVAVAESNVVVDQGKVLLLNLLQTQDNLGARSSGLPAAFRHKLGAGGLVLGVFEDTTERGLGRRALDLNGVAGLDQSGNGRRSERTVLERLGLRAEEDGGVFRHVVRNRADLLKPVGGDWIREEF